MKNNEHTDMIAKTFKGLEEVLAAELTGLGANDVQIERRAVRFSGDKALMYRANFSLRTALRILVPVKTFKTGPAYQPPYSQRTGDTLAGQQRRQSP